MKFTKMHGIGNDYVYVNCFEETVENPSGQIMSRQLILELGNRFAINDLDLKKYH